MEKIRAKKSLGQHFLRSKIALEKLVEAGNIRTGDTVLEIGPGEGVLTAALLERGAHVIAIETDARCIPALADRFAQEITDGALHIIEGDIRDETMQTLLFTETYLGERPYTLIANIPYYITGFLFRLFLEILRQPTRIVFLVQKEVAEEIVARDGKEGLLSLSVKVYGTPRIIGVVKRDAFSPPPKVDSAIIAIENISRDRLAALTDECYFSVVRAGLRSRRKMLQGNLVRAFPEKREIIERAFASLRISRTVRGEDLQCTDWVKLAKEVLKETPLNVVS